MEENDGIVYNYFRAKYAELEKKKDCPKTKPPLGLTPFKMHNETRALGILEAMKRYILVNKQIPNEWFSELKNLYGEKR